MRDQASDEEKCLTFADLLSGSAKNWYRQLGRYNLNKWPDLLRSFQIQYRGLGVSVARQYYYARKRSDESPLEYLYRLNVAGLRARLKIKDGGSKERREHVDHCHSTGSGNSAADLATCCGWICLVGVGRSSPCIERAKNRQKRSAFGSSKYRQKAPTPAPAAPAKHVRAIQAKTSDSGSDSGSDGLDSDEDEHRRNVLAANREQGSQVANDSTAPDQVQQDRRPMDPASHDHRSRIPMDGSDRGRCTHCGSRKHTDLGCWRRLTCQKCGKRGHPADHCLFVCRGCGELLDMGKCLMEKFYNQIRQWYDPTKHAGMLPAIAEKMLN
ncbi:unnamed protein product [Phytophthora lilii]|uniref:Unnamed protein product n=1 Tax=Phytophthora lilii TaxID=2077276 RepID=A0A9W6TXL2_9STRA|nr:unnamed protein product [Phytophthora lilii]